MIRRLARVGVLFSLLAMVGCGSDNRNGTILSISNELSEASNSVEAVTTKLNDYVKSKDAKNEDAAKKDLEEAMAAAKNLKERAKKLQEYYGKALATAPTTDEDKKTLRDANKENMTRAANTIKTASDKHREMKDALAMATKKFGEEPFRGLMQDLQEADTEFAAITRKR